MEYYGYNFIRESDLAHHGIKGQRWGIRRFQKEDGSLTPAGVKRYTGETYDDRSSALDDPLVQQYRESGRSNGLKGAYRPNYGDWNRVTTYNYDSVRDRDSAVKATVGDIKDQLGFGYKPTSRTGYSPTLHGSHGGNYYIDPKYLGGMSAYTIPDRVLEFLTGNIHERDISAIENNIDLLMKSDSFSGVFTEDILRNVDNMNTILADYQDHTLPGLAKKTWNRGKARVASLLSKIGSHFIKR